MWDVSVLKGGEMNAVLSKEVYRHIFIKQGNWLRIMCRILGHTMMQADDEMPVFHARCATCMYEIIAE